jgi:lipoprotein-releasing system ATP-binding protein
MNDDLTRIFSQHDGTYRPKVEEPRAAPPPAAPQRSGGPHFTRPLVNSPVEAASARKETVDRELPVTASSQPSRQAERRDRPRSARDASKALQLEAVEVAKSYRKGNVVIPVLKGISLAVRHGEFLAIIGQSGSGKSTLLHLLGTLDAPDDGRIMFHGHRIDNLPGHQRDQLRNRHIGMIFQFYHLLPELTTLENVLAPLMIGSSVFGFLRSRKEHRATATRLLELVGLSHRLKHTPRELSGGEMQRAAIARALIATPELLLADEPTGNLDQATGQDILGLLCTLNRQQKLTIVMVTHDPAIAERADRVVRLVDGRIEEA